MSNLGRLRRLRMVSCSVGIGNAGELGNVFFLVLVSRGGGGCWRWLGSGFAGWGRMSASLGRFFPVRSTLFSKSGRLGRLRMVSWSVGIGNAGELGRVHFGGSILEGRFREVDFGRSILWLSRAGGDVPVREVRISVEASNVTKGGNGPMEADSVLVNIREWPCANRRVVGFHVGDPSPRSRRHRRPQQHPSATRYRVGGCIWY